MSDHGHADMHEHDHRDENDHPHEPVRTGVWAEDAVLDIGGDVGALILYAGPEYRDREIEVSPIDDDTARIHTAIHERVLNGAPAFAGIYAALPAGEYRVWSDDPDLPDRVTIVGGEVAELDWRREP
jgi:hypothetical protein